MINQSRTRATAPPRDQFGIGVDDTVILPMVFTALLARALYRVAFFLIAFASAAVFALLLRVMTVLLLVAATVGDGMVWLVKQLADLPQPSGAKCEACRDLLDARSSGVRQRLSHEAVVEATQRALHGGLSWIFRRCEALSPRAALFVIAGTMLWLPLSAAISIAMHAALLAHAGLLPAGTQLLHPVATIIAKSKLLVLAAYPAAWPQAKKHAWVQAALRCVDHIVAVAIIQKTAHRYDQTKLALARGSAPIFRQEKTFTPF